jgi:hypothetical protein
VESIALPVVVDQVPATDCAVQADGVVVWLPEAEPLVVVPEGAFVCATDVVVGVPLPVLDGAPATDDDRASLGAPLAVA